MAFTIDVKETAFSVLHCQNDIVTPKGKFAYAGIPGQVKKYNTLENIAKALDATRAAGMMVIYGNYTWKPGYPDAGDKLFQVPIMLGVWKNRVCIKGSQGYENPAIIKPQPTDIIVDNTGTNQFMHTDLDLILRANGISNLVITGTATNWVVNSTTRHGMEIGYNIIIVKDCCQSFNDEMHNFGMNIELPNLATIITLDEYLAALKKK